MSAFAPDISQYTTVECPISAISSHSQDLNECPVLKLWRWDANGSFVSDICRNECCLSHQYILSLKMLKVPNWPKSEPRALKVRDRIVSGKVSCQMKLNDERWLNGSYQEPMHPQRHFVVMA